MDVQVLYDQSPLEIRSLDKLKALRNLFFESCQVHVFLSHLSPNLNVFASHLPNIQFDFLIVLLGFHHFLKLQFSFKNLTIELISLLFEIEAHFVESHLIEDTQLLFL